MLCGPDEQKPERHRAGTINLTSNFHVQLCSWGPSKCTGPGAQCCEEDRRTVLEQGEIYTLRNTKRGCFPWKELEFGFSVVYNELQG